MKSIQTSIQETEQELLINVYKGFKGNLMNKIYNKQQYYALFALIFSFTCINAQNNKIELTSLGDKGVELVGFTLTSAKEIEIEAVGAGFDKEIKKTKHSYVDPKNMFAYAWIINARTRQLEWRMTISNTDEDWWNKFNRTFKGNVRLEKGEYELYFSAILPSYSVESGFFGIRRLFDKVFRGDDWWKEHSESWKVNISGVDEKFEKSAVLKYHNAVKKDGIINLTQVGNSAQLSSGFTLKKPAKIKISALGEGFDGEMYDSAYIINAESRSRVWEMLEENTEYAGGAIKNRKISEEIELDAGDYIVYYSSDDSHCYDEWNSNPPYDPNFWGITISGSGENFDKNIVTKYEEKEGTLIMRLDKLGDDEEVSEGFKIVKPMKLRIYALGEGTDGKMVDYGWIQDIQSGRKVWQMKFDETQEAGGHPKNRLFDAVVIFEPGTYMVYFRTDDSHSYRSWNRAKPYDPQAWGIKIYTVGTERDENYIKKYDPELDQNIIVQLIRVGDDEHVRKQFVLKKPTTLRIYAIGEGDWDEMYDYGWIEDFNTGRIIWEMKYKETRRAGGDSKNRAFDSTLRLDAGTYIAHYRSDPTHAYNSWNASPPRDKSNWGITIYVYNGN
jgi:hypothetical protein